MKQVLIFILMFFIIGSSALAYYPIYVYIDGPIASTRLIEMEGKLYQQTGTCSKLMGSITEALKTVPSTETVTDLVVFINSSGGELQEAFGVYDYLQIAKSHYKVHTVAMGWCCSAAMIILQAGDIRYSTDHTYLMTHKPMKQMLEPTFIRGKDAAELEKGINAVNQMMISLFAQRMNTTNKKIERYFVDDLNNMYGGWEAYKLGFVDKVIMDKLYLFQ